MQTYKHCKPFQVLTKLRVLMLILTMLIIRWRACLMRKCNVVNWIAYSRRISLILLDAQELYKILSINTNRSAEGGIWTPGGLSPHKLSRLAPWAAGLPRHTAFWNSWQKRYRYHLRALNTFLKYKKPVQDFLIYIKESKWGYANIKQLL